MIQVPDSQTMTSETLYSCAILQIFSYVFQIL